MKGEDVERRYVEAVERAREGVEGVIRGWGMERWFGSGALVGGEAGVFGGLPVFRGGAAGAGVEVEKLLEGKLELEGGLGRERSML